MNKLASPNREKKEPRTNRTRAAWELETHSVVGPSDVQHAKEKVMARQTTPQLMVAIDQRRMTPWRMITIMGGGTVKPSEEVGKGEKKLKHF